MLTLAETKTHLRVDTTDEDTHIEALIEAATTSVADFLDMAREDMELVPLPAPVRAAILLRVGDLYENREAQSDRPIVGNPTFERLLSPYRHMSV